MRIRQLAILMLLTVLTPIAKADDKGRFGLAKLNPFKKKEEPAPKAKQLTETLRTDPDEKKRKAAAEELRETEAKQVSEVLPVLVASLKQDPSAAVRATVAESMGKMKPIAAASGAALESASSNDPSEVVRKAAQGALWTYQANGYKLAQQSATTQTNEPPIAKPRAFVAQVPPRQIVASATAPVKPNPIGIPTGINRGPQFGETGEPPLAKTKVEPFEVPIPSPPMPVEIPKVVPPTVMIPTPLPLPPAAPKLPVPPTAMPKAPTVPGTIPTPPPSSNPGF